MDDRALPVRADAAAILRARAVALARPGAAPAAPEILDLLEFRIGQDRYAVETRHVSGVVALGELTYVPFAPPFILGVVNVRGRITAVIDLQKFFDLPQRGLTDLHHIVLLRRPDMEIGLLADAIEGVRACPPGSLQAPLAGASGVRSDCLMGLTVQRQVVIDLDRMLADPKLLVSQQVQGK